MRDGNTPTGVGKTPTKKIGRIILWKHPHGRGEDSVILLPFFWTHASSILVAHKLQAVKENDLPLVITPAKNAVAGRLGRF